MNTVVEQVSQITDAVIARINRREVEIRAGGKTMLANAKEQGEDLLRLKEQIPHGEFKARIKHETCLSIRQAQKYMQVAKNALEGVFDPTPGITAFLSQFGKSKAPRRKPPGVKQAQRSINIPPEDWDRFKRDCDDLGVVAADKLGELVKGFIDPNISKSDLSLTAQQKLDKLEVRLNRQFEDRVQTEVRRRVEEDLMPFYKDRLSQADDLLNQGMYKPVFGNTEYRMILAALHPDSTSERRAEAFDLFKKHELRLRSETKSLSGDLPSSLSDLLARRKRKS